jgi:hypothetical protein
MRFRTFPIFCEEKMERKAGYVRDRSREKLPVDTDHHSTGKLEQDGDISIY